MDARKEGLYEHVKFFPMNSDDGVMPRCYDDPELESISLVGVCSRLVTPFGGKAKFGGGTCPPPLGVAHRWPVAKSRGGVTKPNLESSQTLRRTVMREGNLET